VDVGAESAMTGAEVEAAAALGEIDLEELQQWLQFPLSLPVESSESSAFTTADVPERESGLQQRQREEVYNRSQKKKRQRVESARSRREEESLQREEVGKQLELQRGTVLQNA
jgi:hypothetical protein